MSRKNIILTVIIVIIAFAHLGLTIVICVRAFQLRYWTAFAAITGIVAASLSLAATADVIIAASLSYYLQTSRSGVKSTDSLINKLLVYTINNGILTSAFDVITLTFATAEADNLNFLAIFQVVGNLYTNSMLATLNSRKAHRPTLTVDDVNISDIKMTGATTAHTSSTVPTQHDHQLKVVDIHDGVSTGESMELEPSKPRYV